MPHKHPSAPLRNSICDFDMIRCLLLNSYHHLHSPLSIVVITLFNLLYEESQVPLELIIRKCEAAIYPLQLNHQPCWFHSYSFTSRFIFLETFLLLLLAQLFIKTSINFLMVYSISRIYYQTTLLNRVGLVSFIQYISMCCIAQCTNETCHKFGLKSHNQAWFHL